MTGIPEDQIDEVPAFRPLFERAAGVVRARFEAARGAAGESGQALILALIVVLMLGLVPSITYVTLESVQPGDYSAEAYDAALAAAQAGLQEYRTLLDEYSDYAEYSGSSEPPGVDGGCNPAFTGATSPCTTSWVAVSSPTTTSLPEAFEYTPTQTQLPLSSSTEPYHGQVLLTVTGKAGNGSSAVYRRIEASLALDGATNDVYYSTFEQPGPGDYDQWENVYNSSGTLVTTGADVFDEADLTVPAGSSTDPDPNAGESYAQALCEYDAYDANTFIDWYSQYVSSENPPNSYYPANPGAVPYSSSVPYYGPWYGTFPDPDGTNLTFGDRNSDSNGACPVNYWISSDSFNGPVYSQDELTTCGTPSFTQYYTATPSTKQLPLGWPGAEADGTYAKPYGYVDDPFHVCGTPGSGSDSPSISDPPVVYNTTPSLPDVATEIDTEIQNDQLLGCVYTGPTAIRFYYNTTTDTEEMAVWSPLSQNTYASTVGGTTANCGTMSNETTGEGLCAGSNPTATSCTAQISCPSGGCTASNPGTVQSGDFAIVPLVDDEVIWVQNTPLTTTGLTGTEVGNAWTNLPTAEGNTAYSGCIDPWLQPNSAENNNTCTEGDLIIGGVTNGSMTLGAAANIVIARSLVYSCALTSATAWSTGISGCASSDTETGLVSNSGDVWISDPASGTGALPDSGSAASTQCTDDDNYNISSMTWSNMLPDECYLQNPVLDAAVASLNGFFEIQNWRFASAHGTLYLNGFQAVQNAGQYGVFSGPSSVVNGYALALSYDTRWQYLTPPGYLAAVGAVWYVTNWVSCGESPPPGTNVGACAPLTS